MAGKSTAVSLRPVDDTAQDDGHALVCVMPLIERLLSQIAQITEHALMVTDECGQVLWTGGSAHPRLAGEVGMRWSCAASPIRDPESGRCVGVIDIDGGATVQPAVVGMAFAAARVIEGELRAGAAERECRQLATNSAWLNSLGGTSAALFTAAGRVVAAEPADWLGSLHVVPVEQRRFTLPTGQQVELEPVSDGYLLRAPMRPRAVDPLPHLELSALGTVRPAAWVNGIEVSIRNKLAEILTLLMLHPNGFSAEQLALQLYGESGKPGTVRVEMHRLQRLLGHDIVRASPYRLHASVDADFLRVRRFLSQGEVESAVEHYPGVLLPGSESPELIQVRDELHCAMRSGVVACADPEVRWLFVETEAGEADQELLELLTDELTVNDPRHAMVTARLRRLMSDAC